MNRRQSGNEGKYPAMISARSCCFKSPAIVLAITVLPPDIFSSAIRLSRFARYALFGVASAGGRPSAPVPGQGAMHAAGSASKRKSAAPGRMYAKKGFSDARQSRRVRSSDSVIVRCGRSDQNRRCRLSSPDKYCRFRVLDLCRSSPRYRPRESRTPFGQYRIRRSLHL